MNILYESRVDSHGDEAEKNQKGQLKKTEFLNSADSQYFFTNILGIGPCVSRIN